MKRFTEQFFSFHPQPHDMHLPNEDGMGWKEYSDMVEAYIACYGSILRSSEAIERFALMAPPANSQERYLIVWGVLQAFVIQQDSIRELYKLFLEPMKTYPKVWNELRDLRHATLHPTGKTTRSSSMVFPHGLDDWGVMMQFRGDMIRMRPHILEHLAPYELELIAVTTPIVENLKSRARK